MKNPRNKKDNNSLNPLNDELGSFGLEPPKRNRPVSDDSYVSKLKTEKKGTVPRTKEQKMALNKKKRRLKKKFRIAFGVLGLSCLLVIVVSVCLIIFCKIEVINVSDCEHYESEQILSVLPIETQKNLFLIDKETAEKKLCENLPYIYSVDIKRKLPSTVEVNITEVKKLYYIQSGEGMYTYFDDNFKVIEINATEPPENAIEIRKLATKDVILGQSLSFTDETLVPEIEELISVVKELQLEEITAIYSESKLSNYLVYEDRIIIKIGEIADVENKVYSALAAIDKLNSVNPQAEGTMTATGGKQVYFTEQK